MQKNISQACFLVLCTMLAMASLALILQIQLQDYSKLVSFVRGVSHDSIELMPVLSMTPWYSLIPLLYLSYFSFIYIYI